jgi:hypothetical protein
VIRITPRDVAVLLTELRSGLARYCEGGVPAQRDGAAAQIEALVKFVECVLDASGMPGGEQSQLFEPIRELHAAVTSQNHLANPALLQPLPAGGRRPVEIAEDMWRGEAAAAYELWMKAHRGSDKDRDKLAAEIAAKIGSTIKGASIKEYRRNATSGEYPRLAARYEEMLQLAEEHFPGEPAKAAEKLAASARKQAR